MVAVDALIDGIPVYSHELSATSTVSKHPKDFGEHFRPTNRTEWLATLSYHQYTSDEFASGLFKDIFKELYQI